MNLKERVEQRLRVLNVSPITLAKSVGLERGFINDILIGRKKTVRGDRLVLLAQALQCTPAFLAGETTVAQPEFEHPGVHVLGVCESGAWREPTARPDFMPTLPIALDPRFPNAPQGAYVLHGYSGADSSRFLAAAIVIRLADFQAASRAIENGMTVVVSRERDGLVEVSLRRVSGSGRERSLIALACDRTPSEPILLQPKGPPKGTTILAVVTCIVRLTI